jgi:hypothetical protein
MKRLHDVAVRMRPRVPRRPDGAPRVSEEDGAATTEQTVPPTAGAGFSKPGDAPRIPARNAFMPSSRDLARQAAEAADDFPLDAPEADTPATAADGPPQDTTQSATVTDHTPGPDRPISRRQIWDLEPDELEDVASQSVITDRTYLPDGPADAEADDTFEEGAPSETGGASEDDMASRALRALQQAEQQLEARGIPAAALYEGDGAKTRVLGFHSPDLETDAISAVARKSVGDVRFPAGWIVVVEGPGRGAYFAVTNSVSSIGRGLDQSICLNFGDASISRNNHAAIAYDAEQNRFFLGHGNKSNIVRRNGQPVLSTEELLSGDAIRIGKTTLRFVALCGEDFTWGVDPEEENADAD